MKDWSKVTIETDPCIGVTRRALSDVLEQIKLEVNRLSKAGGWCCFNLACIISILKDKFIDILFFFPCCSFLELKRIEKYSGKVLAVQKYILSTLQK